MNAYLNAQGQLRYDVQDRQTGQWSVNLPYSQAEIKYKKSAWPQYSPSQVGMSVPGGFYNGGIADPSRTFSALNQSANAAGPPPPPPPPAPPLPAPPLGAPPAPAPPTASGRLYRFDLSKFISRTDQMQLILWREMEDAP